MPPTMVIRQPACDPCKKSDHTHCRNWVQQGQDTVYCACFWANHTLVAQ